MPRPHQVYARSGLTGRPTCVGWVPNAVTITTKFRRFGLNVNPTGSLAMSLGIATSPTDGLVRQPMIGAGPLRLCPPHRLVTFQALMTTLWIWVTLNAFWSKSAVSNGTGNNDCPRVCPKMGPGEGESCTFWCGCDALEFGSSLCSVVLVLQFP